MGAALLLGTAALVAWVVARRPDRLTILTGVTVLALAFFAAPTRVHERYLFPFFGLAAILVAFSWRWRIAYAVAGVATFLNMYVVLVAFYPDNPHVSDWLGIGGALREPLVVWAIVLLHTGAFAWGLAQLRGGAHRSLAAELESGARDTAPEETEALPAIRPAPGPALARGMAAAATVKAATLGGRPPAPGVAPARAPRRVPAWYDRPSWTDMGPIAWLRARVGETPIRPDRSAGLAGERGGRLDRLDLFLVVVLVVGALALRMYRVGDPPRMHFDEVYHARTAAEFLQDWRYDMPHDIYEWTHPHLAKYAMALGIVAFAGHDVDTASSLGVSVDDAAIEPRREDPAGGGARTGERMWVVTGSELIAYDLVTRRMEARWAVPGAISVAFDDQSLQLLVGTEGGDLLALDTGALGTGSDPANPGVEPAPVVTLDGPVTRIAPFQDGSHAAVVTGADTVSTVDVDGGEVTGTARIAGVTDVAGVSDVQALMAVPAAVTDADAAAAKLVELIGGDEAAYRSALTSTDDASVLLASTDVEDHRSILDGLAKDAASLAGVEYQAVPTVAVTGSDGLTFLDSAGRTTSSVALTGAAGLAQVTGVDDGAQLYVTTTDATTGEPEITVVAITGEKADAGPEQIDDFALPAAGTRVVYDDASELVEVLGGRPDADGSTVYVIEPHGRSVFADHAVPFGAVALALDHNALYPSSSHGSLLAFGAGGEAASMDVGSYQLAWRLPGVILGALTVAVLYLLARVLFRRRSVALLAGTFVVLDGMFFVQSRIAMNDVYTAFFILSAYLLFAWMWLNSERTKRAFWVVAPVMGVLLGLALASKWVAAYAIGALGILWLMRSALGRVVLIAGMIAVTALLGWMALSVPADSTGAGNLPFVLIMIGLTMATVAITVYRPIEWSDDEVRFAVAAPAALGILLAFTAMAAGKAETTFTLGSLTFTPIEVGFALVVVGLLAYVAFAAGGRLGVGPMAKHAGAEAPAGGPPAASPAPDGWVRLGWGLGLPAAWMVVSLLVIPLAVYVALYLPWAFDGNAQIVAGFPAGHTGETLVELTTRMYDYHNGLTAAHAASSPWWAWPLNLKPVWFYQGSYAENTAASIYDAGNLVIWWLGIPAMVFVAFQAYRRRSLSLALILVAFLAQWVSWARIDRAAFQYHYYTSLPFVVLALGYFVAEIWHGASRRTWLLARASAAAALMGAVILWLVRLPVLCRLAGVESVNAGSQACVLSTQGSLVVTPATAAMVVVLLVTGGALIWQLVSLGRPRADGRGLTSRDLVSVVLTAVAGGVALVFARQLPDAEPVFSMGGIVPELIALLIAVPLGLVALQVLTARDARRFAVGVVVAAATWFVVLYPNISALPMPASLVNAYQGLLPTYLYAFQFAVDTIPRPETTFADPKFLVLAAFLVVACGVVAYAAWAWRQALAQGPEEGGEDTGPASEAGPA